MKNIFFQLGIAGLFLVLSQSSYGACLSASETQRFCDDFESNTLDQWIDVSGLSVAEAPVGGPSGNRSALLNYVQGTTGPGWMWRKSLREDNGDQDSQFIRWWQYWDEGFEWASDVHDQKIFMLDALSPQNAWGQTANWKVYLHLVGTERQAQGIARNELFVDTFLWSGDGQFDGEWRGLRQNLTTVLYRTGIWECSEVELKHNSPGIANGQLRVWINDQLVMDHSDLKFRTDPVSWNAVQMTGWYGDPGGVPQDQVSYIDDVVVSTERIGCGNQVKPKPPSDLKAE